MPNEFGTDAFDGTQQQLAGNAPQGGVGNQMPDVPPAPAPQQPTGAMPQQPGAPQTPYQQYQQPQYRQPSDPYVTPPGTVYGDNGIIPPSGMPAPQRAKVNGILTTGQKVGYTLLPMFLGVIGFLIVWLVCRDDGDDFNRAAVRQALIGLALGIVMWVVIAILALVCIFGLLAVVIAAAA